MFFFSLLFSLTSLANAGGYFTSAIISTSAGTAYQSLSGKFLVAASSATSSTPTITLDGTIGTVSALNSKFLGLTVSTSAVSPIGLCIVGAVNSLPSSGWNEGCFLWDASLHKPAVSTQTVTSINSWRYLW